MESKPVLKAKDMDITGVVNFCCEMMERAKEDYISCRNHWRGINSEKKISKASIRKFLRSELGEALLFGVDPESVIRNWDEQSNYELWRDKKKCRKCSTKKCVHKEGSYTKEYICKKEERKKRREEQIKKTA